MSTRTVRLDPQADQALVEIQESTGYSITEVVKAGILTLRDSLRAQASDSPYGVYSQIDLGPGGYARASSANAKKELQSILKRKHHR